MPQIEIQQDTRGEMVPIAQYDVLEEAQEYALVVLAMNLDCLITANDGKFVIHAQEAFAIAVTEEFILYEKEQSEAVETPVLPVFGSGVELLLAWTVVLFFCFSMQQESASFTDQYLNSSAGIMQNGEVYRAFTALFLHGDFEHLMGNILYGSVFCLLVANSLGPWTGWGLILASGFLGNLTNAVLHHEVAFRSLGASTATFGALGLLVGVGLYQAWLDRSVRSGIRTLVPLAIGVMLFAMFGIGSPDPSSTTDVMAHVLGLGFGILLGVPFSKIRTGLAGGTVMT